MLTAHEAQAAIRDLLPAIREINGKITEIFSMSVGPTGPQGCTGPESDISYAFQFLDGSKNMVHRIARQFDLPLPDRGDHEAERERCALVSETEPEPEGPMPFKSRLLTILHPERSVRAAVRATKASIAKKIRQV